MPAATHWRVYSLAAAASTRTSALELSLGVTPQTPTPMATTKRTQTKVSKSPRSTGRRPCVLAIGGLDPGGGAGVLVDARAVARAGAFESMTLMFQQEVAERIVAAPDTEGYGRMAVAAQWRCQAHLVLRLPPGAFSPPPKVWSAVVHLVPHATQPDPVLARAMERVTAAAFGQRRKMLRQSLKPLAPDAEALIRAAGIDPTARPEQLSVTDFAALARALT